MPCSAASSRAFPRCLRGFLDHSSPPFSAGFRLLFTDAPTAWEFSLQVTPVARLPVGFSQMPRPVGCTGIRCGTLGLLDAGWQTRVLPYAYEIRVWIITRTGGCILAIIKDPKRTNGTLVSLELRSTAGGGRQNEKRTFCAVVFAQSLIVYPRVLHLPLVARVAEAGQS